VRTAVLGLGAVLGAVVKVGIEAMVHSTAETADHLDDLSQSTGIGARRCRSWRTRASLPTCRWTIWPAA
jgi:hypothetical protein